MADDVSIIALKQRRAIFAAHGQTEKVKAVDVELARMRGTLPPDPAKAKRDDAPTPEPEPAATEQMPEQMAETADADLTGVEVATATPRRGRPPRQG